MTRPDRWVWRAVASWFMLAATVPVWCADLEDAATPAGSDAEAVEDPEEALEPRAADSIEAYREIVERPLFSETRRPPDPSETPAAEAAPATPQAGLAADFQLLGVVITPTVQRAMLKSTRDEKPELRTLGDEVDGWRLDTVEPRRVRLTRGDLEKAVELERKAAPQAQPPSRQAARRRAAAAAQEHRTGTSNPPDEAGASNQTARPVEATTGRIPSVNDSQ